MKKVIALMLTFALLITSVFCNATFSAATETDSVGLAVDNTVHPGYWLDDRPFYKNDDSSQGKSDGAYLVPYAIYYGNSGSVNWYSNRGAWAPAVSVGTGVDGSNALRLGIGASSGSANLYNQIPIVYKLAQYNSETGTTTYPLNAGETYTVQFDLKEIYGTVGAIYTNFFHTWPKRLTYPTLFTASIEDTYIDKSTGTTCVTNSSGVTAGYSDSDITDGEWNTLNFSTTLTGSVDYFFINLVPEDHNGAVVLIDNIKILDSNGVNVFTCENVMINNTSSAYQYEHTVDVSTLDEIGSGSEEKPNDDGLNPATWLGTYPFYKDDDAANGRQNSADVLPYASYKPPSGSAGWYSNRAVFAPTVVTGVDANDKNALKVGVGSTGSSQLIGATAFWRLAKYDTETAKESYPLTEGEYTIKFDVKEVSGTIDRIYTNFFHTMPVRLAYPTKWDSDVDTEFVDGSLDATFVYNSDGNLSGYTGEDLTDGEWNTLTYTTRLTGTLDFFFINVVPADSNGAIVYIDNIEILDSNGNNLFNSDNIMITSPESEYRYNPICYNLGTFDTGNNTPAQWNESENTETPNFSEELKNAGGLAFTGGEEYTVNSAFTAVPKTFEATIYIPQDLKERCGVIFGNSYSADASLSFEIHTDSRPYLRYADGNKNIYHFSFTNATVPYSRWTHIAITADSTNGNVSCYIDGILAETMTGIPEIAETVIEQTFNLGGDLRKNNTAYFKGSLKNVAVYSEVRTAQQINKDIESVDLNDSSLIAYYDLSNTYVGEEISDISQNSYDISCLRTWFTDKKPVTDYAYSFCVVGDTQKIAYYNPQNFHYIYDWIVDNADDKKMSYVFGLGDITENTIAEEWLLAQENIFKLNGVVPYSLIRGNHDGTVGYNKYFGVDEYKNQYNGVYYQDGKIDNSYTLFTAGGIDYMQLSLDYGASDAVLEWAGNAIASHPNHKVIVTTHAYMDEDGTLLEYGDDHVMPDSKGTNDGTKNNGDHMWEKLFSKHKNIFLVLSGHIHSDDVVVRQKKGIFGNTVTQMLIDPQDVDKRIRDMGGSGMVVMLYFSEDGESFTVEQYSTIQQKYYMSTSQFDLEAEPFGEFQTGDLNGDGTVNAIDIVRLKKILVGLAETEGSTCDIDDDGIIAILDLATLREFIMDSKNKSV